MPTSHASASAALPRPAVLDPAARRRFHDDGFTVAPALVPRELALDCRSAALALHQQTRPGLSIRNDPVFHQLINVWRIDERLRGLTLHPRLLAATADLAGRPMRLWHDQLFIKRAAGSHATHFHQDLPYWPVPRDAVTVSAWIALGDIGEDSGCLTFIPGTQHLRGAASDLDRCDSLVELHPEIAFRERVTIPLRAGGCTFHQGYSAHRAGANHGGDERVALSVIFIAADTPCDGVPHVLTQEFGLRAGELFPDAFCPRI